MTAKQNSVRSRDHAFSPCTANHNQTERSRLQVPATGLRPMTIMEKKTANSHLKLNRKEIILMIAVIAAALISWIVMKQKRESVDYGSVTITVNGEKFGTYSLDKDQRIDINGTNTLRIRNHEAKMIEATCPDHICMSEDAIGQNGGFIICLPNRVIVEGIPAESSTENGLDGVAQ